MTETAIALRTRTGVVRAYALVDAEDYAWLSLSRWSLHGNGYAHRRHGLMHRDILKRHELLPEELEVDHINRDRLDNRKSNLRAVTHGANRQNTHGWFGVTTSPFRGVSFNRRARLWEAYSGMDGRKVHIGLFRDEWDAAMAAAVWRAEHLPFSVEEFAS